ncbi:DedA family protein [uncultured Campylobacter sp.]|uniref:DedA family protein n=1 Tax=uncultured Campylobacter sp. TaxID=218934 RepID=UPI00261A250E|nr:DedA family protein [uncultured Campylobacter sp.]
MQEFLRDFLNNYQQYAYIIIFVWCVIEGELALILGGIFAHEGYVNLGLIILFASFGAFLGDQLNFYIGRYSKGYINKKLAKQRQKFAIAHLLLQKYGWPIIFVQRYMYGFRTIIPMSIGVTRYDAKKFAIINLVSSFAWATKTILLAWYFGDEIWQLVAIIERHWYIAVPLIVLFLGTIIYIFKRIEKNILTKRKERDDKN